MQVEQVQVGIYQTNCYLLKEDNHVLIIDPGKKAERIMSHINDGEVIDAIILTHGHFDHIGAVDDIVNLVNCPIYINQKDEVLIRDCPENQMDGYEGKIYHSVKYLTEGQMTIGHFDLIIYNTPGHTEGSVLIGYKDALFTGDTLFERSCGRTDLYLGNDSKMIQSLKFIKTLDENYILYPGHGNITRLKNELISNPYLGGYEHE